jgi:hypothetical protein
MPPIRRRCYRLSHDRFGWPAGTIVYDSPVGSYGLVGEDDRRTGVRHAFVTVDWEPRVQAKQSLQQALSDRFESFTCPIEYLEPIENPGLQ